MEQNGYKEERPQKNSRTLIVALVLLIIFVLILILFLYLIRRPALFGSFAQSETTSVTQTAAPTSITPQSVSIDNSYLFASPLKASVNVERVRITAYVLDGQGMGVPGKQVTLGGSNSSVQIYSVSPVTDDYGRATFDITGSVAGLFTFEASVDGKNLGQKVTVSFE